MTMRLETSRRDGLNHPNWDGSGPRYPDDPCDPASTFVAEELRQEMKSARGVAEGELVAVPHLAGVCSPMTASG
jgi:hypothetical protein